MVCDWTLLPYEVLDLILQKLSRVVDFLRSSAVCKSWYSVARQNKTKRQAVPMLLVPTPDNKEDKRSLYSVAKNQIYDFQLNIPSNKRLAGSSHGWLVIADKCLTSENRSVCLTLLNPFSGKTICLPPVRSFSHGDGRSYSQVDGSDNHGDSDDSSYCNGDSSEDDHNIDKHIGDGSDNHGDSAGSRDSNGYSFRDESSDSNGDSSDEDGEDDGFSIEYRIAKVALSRDPHLYPENFELMITLSEMHRLVLYKSSEKSWIYIADHPKLGMYFADVIFYKEMFYFVDLNMGLGRIDVVETSSNSNTTNHGCVGGVSSLAPRIELVLGRLSNQMSGIKKKYIVETSNGDLLLVQRFLKEVEQYPNHLITWDFKLHKLQSLSWVPIDSLGDDFLFLGDNHSISVSTLQFPECQRNCIYYSDDQFNPYEYKDDGPVDIGIFNLANRSFTSHYLPDPGKKHMPPPIWILPILQGYQ